MPEENTQLFKRLTKSTELVSWGQHWSQKSAEDVAQSILDWKVFITLGQDRPTRNFKVEFALTLLNNIYFISHKMFGQ